MTGVVSIPKIPLQRDERLECALGDRAVARLRHFLTEVKNKVKWPTVLLRLKHAYWLVGS